ncbi:MAG: hypothetical protein AAF213_12225 [Pseudomonadota bacterium]
MSGSDAQNGDIDPQSVEAQHKHMVDVSQQLEYSAKELIGYVARLDRLERRLAAHTVKTTGRLVAITRRADTVVDALAEREQSFGKLCDAMGLAPVKGEDTDFDMDRARLDQTMNQMDVMANAMVNMAEQLDTMFEAVALAQDDASQDEALDNHLQKLRQGMTALDQVINLKQAS